MKADNFKLIMIIVFLAMAVLAVLVFAGVIKIGGSSNKASGPTGTVTMWGSVRRELIATGLDDFNNFHDNLTVRYVYIPEESFDRSLLEAIASGQGPDLFLLPDNLAHSYANKIYTIPYASYPIASFKNFFAQAGDVFLTPSGVLAFPMVVDPLVMYYNRSILNSNDIVYPPAYWDEFVDMVTKLTKKDDTKQITQSAVALGQYGNVRNAKDILTTLFMQAGNNIVDQVQGAYYAVLREPGSSKATNLGPILSFYTSFADPLKGTYSWNSSLPSSDAFFSSDKSAFYFGFASELKNIQDRNPNLNFGVTSVPQIKNSNFKVTRAKVLGLAISSFSKKSDLAFNVATLLASENFALRLAESKGAPPARRDLLNIRPIDSYGPVFYSSALYGKSWLDPDPIGSNNIFKNMVEKVLSNNMTAEEAILDANGKLTSLLFQ